MTVPITAPSAAANYLLATNILVHYVRGDALGQRIEATYAVLTTPSTPRISIVTEGELRSLAIQWAWGRAKLRQMETLIARFVSVSLDHPGLIPAYAALDAYSRSVGRRMGKNDLWIAATARVTGGKLLTTDADFDHLAPAFLDRDLVT